MDFGWVTLSVSDLDRSLSFYQDVLGLKLQRRFNPNSDMEIAFVGNVAQTQVELIYDKNIAGKAAQNSATGTGITLGFLAPSLDEALALIKEKNIPVLRGPLSPSPDITFFFVQDPDGYEIQIAQQK
jgi:lactoylglutathione lyase